MKRLALAALVLASSCLTPGKAEVSADDIDDVLGGMTKITRSFSYCRTPAPKEKDPCPVGSTRGTVIDGLVEDDYRYQAKVTRDGVPFYEEVVRDDARYLRVLDPSRLPPVAASDPSMQGLLDGRWIVDRTGAPPEFAQPTKGEVPLNPQTVLGAVRFFETAPELLRKGTGVNEFNEDAADYLPKEDRFRKHERSGKRFDAKPKSFDPAIIPTSVQDLEPYFLYLALWVDGRTVTRFEKVFDLPPRRDSQYKEMYEQLEQSLTAQGALLTTTLSDLKRGRVPKFGERYEITVAEEGESVAEPPDAVEVDLAAITALLAGGAQPAAPVGAAPGLGQIPIPTPSPG